jgi:hypothetical protein
MLKGALVEFIDGANDLLLEGFVGGVVLDEYWRMLEIWAPVRASGKVAAGPGLMGTTKGSPASVS